MLDRAREPYACACVRCVRQCVVQIICKSFFHLSFFVVQIDRRAQRSAMAHACLLRLRALASARRAVAQCRRSRCSAAAAPQEVSCFYADWAEVPLPAGHRFPMGKYRDTRTILEEDASLVGRLKLVPSPLAALDDVRRAHCPAYVERVLDGTLTAAEQRAVGFPWSKEHVMRSLASTGGTLAATRLVLENGARCAMQIAGGTHHAHHGSGEGFCVFNDIATASHLAMAELAISRVLVVDLGACLLAAYCVLHCGITDACTICGTFC